MESIETDRSRGIEQLPTENGPYTFEWEPVEEAMKFVRLPDDPHTEVMHNLLVFLDTENPDAIVETRANAGSWGPLEDYVKVSANLVLGEVAAWCNRMALHVTDYPIAEDRLVHAARCLLWTDHLGIDKNRAIRHVIDRMIEDRTLDAHIALMEIEVSNDSDELLIRAKEAIASMPAKVSEYKGGKLGIANLFVGMVMKSTAGKYRANDVKAAVDAALSEA
jgi:Asp-tRNA(Asn)/Glu-tRNA(Gln) amidotransferase B subunit